MRNSANDNKPVTQGILKKEIQVVRKDLKTATTTLRTDMQGMETTLRTEMQGMETTLRTEMQEMKMELRTEMRGIKTELEQKMFTKDDHEKFMVWLMGVMVTRTEFESAIADLKETMATKKDMQKLYDYMDAAMTEIQAAREERELSSIQVLRIDDIVFDHEKRISILERKSVCSKP